jgi:hypothetical protein
VLIAIVICSTFAHLLQAQSPGRVIIADGRTPLTQMVTNEDEIVVVQPSESEVRAIPFTEAAGAAHTVDGDVQEMLRADGIFVADVRDRRSYLVEGDTWIRSSIQFSVVSTIRDARPTITDSNRLLIVERNSGEVRVRKALVGAGDTHHFKPGERYLLGLKRFVAGRPPVLLFSYRVDRKGELVKPDIEMMDSQPNSVLYGKQLAEVVFELTKRIGQ